MEKRVKKIPQIDYKVCIACGVCYQACPTSCIKLTKTDFDIYRKAYPQVENLASCTGCGICSKVCPIGVITMVEV